MMWEGAGELPQTVAETVDSSRNCSSWLDSKNLPWRPYHTHTYGIKLHVVVTFGIPRLRCGLWSVVFVVLVFWEIGQ